MLQERYIAMLTQVAMRFRGDEAVLGYEIMNEPIGSDDLIAAFHAKAAAAMRAVDDRHLLSFEPSATRNFTNASPLADRPFADAGGLYSVHIYTSGGITGSVAAGREEADSWKAPLVLTEAGVPTQDQAGHEWITTLLDALDQARGSLAYWLWKDGLHIQAADGSWGPNTIILSGLSRPYAQALGGDPTGTRWDGHTLTVGFRGRGDVPARHRVYWNQGQPTITCDGQAIAAPAADPATSLYEVACGGAGAHTLVFAAGN
jgi:hypothetical protein